MQGASNYGTADNHGRASAAANYLPQGAGSQHLPGQKPPISSHADPNATHPYNDDMLRAKVLCRYPGCSFYAIPGFENYCQDSYERRKGCPLFYNGVLSRLQFKCFLSHSYYV